MANGLTSTNYKAILSQAQGQVSQLLSLTGGANTNTYVNSIYTLIQDGSAFVDGNADQKGAAIQSIISKLTDLLGSLGTNENAKANKKVQAEDNKIKENEEKAENINQTLDSKLQDIMEQCAQGVISIQNALAEIEKLGGNQGLITELNEKLKEQVKIIDTNKEILNSENSDPEKRKEALAAILGAASVINELVSQIGDIKTALEQQNAIVEENAQNIADLQTGATEILNEGFNELTDNALKNQQLTVNNTALTAESATEDAAGAHQVAIGTAMESTIIGGASGTKYIISGNDKLVAGATLMQGAVTNFASLAQADGKIRSYVQNCAGFIDGINQFAEGATAVVGEYDTLANSVITSVGSLSAYTEGNAELQSYTQQYMSDFDNYNKNAESTNQPQQNETLNDKADRVKSMDADKINFKKFEFNTAIFSNNNSK